MIPYPAAVILDVDGVLLDWCKGFHAYMARRGNYRIESEGYDLAHHYPRVDITSCIHAFSLTPEYAELDHLPGAVEGVMRLRQLYPDRPFIAVTCCGVHEDVIAVRNKALTLFNLDGIVALPIDSHKINFFKCMKQSLVIEDSPRNIQDAERCHHVAICFDQPWNKGVQDNGHIRRVFSWDQMTSEATLKFIGCNA